MRSLSKFGLVSTTTAIIGALGTVLAAGLMAWGSASATTEDIRGDVRVVEERENNHYAETQRQLIELNQKMDRLLVSNGVPVTK
jgi:hypothetical protein